MTVISPPVAASGDDVTTRNDAQFFTNVAANTIGFDGTFTFENAMRFSLAIPQGATINTAALLCTARFTQAGAGTLTRFQAEVVDNSGQIVSFADFQTRKGNLTVAFVDFNAIPAFTNGLPCPPFPDISTVVQEIINRAGWVSGNFLNLFWTDQGSTPAGATRNIASFDLTPAPVLTIDFTPTGPPPPPNLARGHGPGRRRFFWFR